VLGFDEAPFTKLLDPPIAVVSREPRAVGRAAAEMLLRLLGGAPPRQVTVPTTVKPGASTTLPAA
jgi:LacI family transcriptional regulator, galactose operon repressor